MDSQELTQLLKDVKIKVDLVHEALLGNPLDQNKPGIMLRVDRTEQSLKVVNRYIWILLTVITTMIGTLIVRTVT